MLLITYRAIDNRLRGRPIVALIVRVASLFDPVKKDVEGVVDDAFTFWLFFDWRLAGRFYYFCCSKVRTFDKPPHDGSSAIEIEG